MAKWVKFIPFLILSAWITIGYTYLKATQKVQVLPPEEKLTESIAHQKGNHSIQLLKKTESALDQLPEIHQIKKLPKQNFSHISDLIRTWDPSANIETDSILSSHLSKIAYFLHEAPNALLEFSISVDASDSLAQNRNVQKQQEILNFFKIFKISDQVYFEPSNEKENFDLSVKVFSTTSERLFYNKIFPIEFAESDATITRDFQIYATQLIKYLKKHPNKRILIEGHTDNLGDDLANSWMSEQRALKVKHYLQDEGIDNQVIAKGLGGKLPIREQTTYTGRKYNRRIVIKVY